MSVYLSAFKLCPNSHPSLLSCSLTFKRESVLEISWPFPPPLSPHRSLRERNQDSGKVAHCPRMATLLEWAAQTTCPLASAWVKLVMKRSVLLALEDVSELYSIRIKMLFNWVSCDAQSLFWKSYTKKKVCMWHKPVTNWQTHKRHGRVWCKEYTQSY